MVKRDLPTHSDQEKREELGELAGRDKSDPFFAMNEAIDLYPSVNEWQVQRIKVALKQAKEGKFSTRSHVSHAIERWQKHLSS